MARPREAVHLCHYRAATGFGQRVRKVAGNAADSMQAGISRIGETFAGRRENPSALFRPSIASVKAPRVKGGR